MDYKLSAIIKKEKEKIFEDDDDDDISKRCWDIGMKVETDPDVDDWRIQKVLSDCQKSRIYQEIHKKDTQTCGICNNYFSDSHSLYKHSLIHLTVLLIKQTFFICNTCHRFYTKKNSLKFHIIKKHRPSKLYESVQKSRSKCQFCNKTYPYKAWYDHMRTVHRSGNWKCEFCDAEFKRKKYLQSHIKCKHEDCRSKPERPWQCPQCPSKFYNKYCLPSHMKNCHSDSDETFHCKICKSKFRCKPYLLKHMMRVHYDDGTVLSCNICGKICKSPPYLQAHMRYKHDSKSLK